MPNDDLDVARQIACGVRDGTVDVVEGCRKILSYRRVVQGVSDRAWDVIVAIDSETDDLPVGDERKNWDADALAAKRASVAAYIERVGPAVRDAFIEIARALGG